MDKKATAEIRRLLALEANPNYAMTIEQKNTLTEWRATAGGEDFSEQVLEAEPFLLNDNPFSKPEPADGQAQHVDIEETEEAEEVKETEEKQEEKEEEPKTSAKKTAKKTNKKSKNTKKETVSE